MNSPYPPRVYGAFSAQKATAKQRGIAFDFTIEDWWQWWRTDDRWARRGCRIDDLVMARFNDQGPYSLANVYCATVRQNNHDKGPIIRRWHESRRASGLPSRMPTSVSVQLTEPQDIWLRHESKRLGISVGELVRRIIDEARSRK